MTFLKFKSFSSFICLLLLLLLLTCLLGILQANLINPNLNSKQEAFYTVDSVDGVSRAKRELNAINVTTSPSSEPVFNASLAKVVNLKDSHEQLTVHWAGKGSPVIICLAKNRKSSRRNKSSVVYISHNYGESFEKISVFKVNGSPAVIDTFYISPVLNSYYLFEDQTNKCIFITKDFGKNFQRIDLQFTPRAFLLHQTIPNLILAKSLENDTHISELSDLYLSENFGLSWRRIQQRVGYVSWSVEGIDLGVNAKTIYLQRYEPSGLTTVLSTTDFFTNASNVKVWLDSVEHFELNGRFMFATSPLPLLPSAANELWVSVDRDDFSRAIIPHDLPVQLFSYYIADITPESIFLCVTEPNGVTNLYTSDENFLFHVFSLSMENILFFHPKLSNWLPGANHELIKDQEFADLHRVAGLRGIYIVSKWKNNTRKSVSDIITLMTFDMGNKWHKIKPPMVDALGHKVVCPTQNCSLHLSQRYLSINSNIKPILTRESAVGFILATGVIGNSLKGKQNIYLSVDAGQTWRHIFHSNYLYGFGDFGAIIVAVPQYSTAGVTNVLYYSIDDGESFSALRFSVDKIRVYGLLTEPGEKNAVFTIFGSKEKTHEWIIIQLNCTNLFKSQCKIPEDYKEWAPHDFESDCLLGSTQIFQRRIASQKCYNGVDFVRPVAKLNCPCKPSDYECDAGFVMDRKAAGFKCIPYEGMLDNFANMVPNGCMPGKMFNKTKGYRKLIGDTCEGGEEDWYSPQVLPCPFTRNITAFVLFVQRLEISMISLNTFDFIKDSIIPKSFLSNAIAADFDLQKSCLFWSDISLNRIFRYCFDGKQIQPEVIVESGLDSVEGIAFNQINGHLYFVNGNKSKVELIDTNINYEGRMRRTILSEPSVTKPRGIAIDPLSSYLFVTDWSSNAAIVRSDLDGSDIKVLFNSLTVNWPNGITVDHASSRIYWVDAKHDYIATSDYDGKDFHYVLYGDQAPHPFALGVFKDMIFYDDWILHKLIMINKHNSTHRKVILDNVTGAMDLKVITNFYHKQSNACSGNHTCSHLCAAKPFNSYRCLCPDGYKVTLGVDGNEKCSCPENFELTKTGTCRPTLANVTCSPNEFKCDNGDCVSRYWKCDDDDDCGDNSDEKYCHSHQCKPHEFKCKSTGNCILDLWVCDFEKECDDGSDEDPEMCSSHYPQCNWLTQFQCTNHRCIDRNNVCDNIDHCRDGSDEINCHNSTTETSNTCDEHHFRCANGDCIQSYWRCDGYFDCLDKSDEHNCNLSCLPNEFDCPNFICIDKLWVCDHDKDCIDGSDEKNCTYLNPTTPGPNTTEIADVDHSSVPNFCPDSWYRCNTDQCIPLEWYCDGNPDCPDGSDELHCSETQPSNTTGAKDNICGSESKFFCYKSNQCIFATYVCDGDNDCTEGEDELNCKHISHSKCPDSFFSCILNVGCIPQTRVCDGKKDCIDGSDEWACVNIKVPVNSICLGFTCTSGDCIDTRYICDGKLDCHDGSDELNCGDIAYAVDTLSVIYDSITTDQFTIQWRSPNTSLNFTYLPAYSHHEDHSLPINTTWTVAENYTFTKLQRGSTYKVFVYSKLINNGTIYQPKAFIKVTTKSNAPKPPLQFTANLVLFNQVLLKWMAPKFSDEAIKGYKVYYSPPEPPFSKLLEYDINQIQLCCFQVGVNYTFWVTSLTKNLESVDSSKISIMIDPLATISKLWQKSVTNSSVLLSWQTHPFSSRISKWLVVYKCENYMSSFIRNVTVSTNEVLVSGLSPEVNYQFYLYPYIDGRAWLEGVQDNMISVRTLGTQLPSIVVRSSISGSVVSLNWDTPTSYNNRNDIPWKYAVFIGRNVHTLKKYAETADTRIVLKNLFACELYIVEVRVIEPFGIGPPPSVEYIIKTHFDPTSPPTRIDIQHFKKNEYRISWNSSCQESDENLGYLVYVKNIVNGEEDRFRFRPNKQFYHNLDLSIHHGATYEIKVSTDHPDARWSEAAFLTAPSMPAVPKLVAYLNEKGDILIMWKTVDNFLKDDYTIHSLQYQVYIHDNQDVEKGYKAVVKEPPFVYEPKVKSSLYYIAVSLVDNHGYSGPLSPTFYLYSNQFAPSKMEMGVFEILVLIVLLALSVMASYVVVKKLFMRKTTIPFAVSSHYNSRSDSATLSSYDNLADDDTNVYSDDEPLVLV